MVGLGYVRVVRASYGGKSETKNPLFFQTVFFPQHLAALTINVSISIQTMSSNFIHDFIMALCVYISVLTVGE